jgi:hypothetical protein
MPIENPVEDMHESSANLRSRSMRGIQTIRDRVKDFVEGVKEKSPRDAIRNFTEAAGQAKDQAKTYVESKSVSGFADDLAGVIRRYPVQALVVGLAFGFLLTRRRGN